LGSSPLLESLPNLPSASPDARQHQIRKVGGRNGQRRMTKFVIEARAIENRRHAQRMKLQKQRRDQRRAKGLTTRGEPYQKLKWKFKRME